MVPATNTIILKTRPLLNVISGTSGSANIQLGGKDTTDDGMDADSRRSSFWDDEL
jgi:hypothetical protein